VVAAVQDGSVDLGLALLTTVPHNVVARSLGPVEMVIVAAPNHHRAGRTVIPDGLAGETLLWTNGANLTAPLDTYGLNGRCSAVRCGDTEK
jgi:DNA-binding transcriptional LysR family regulator